MIITINHQKKYLIKKHKNIIYNNKSKNKILLEVKVVVYENDNFELLDFIEFEKDLIYNKLINNINCGILLSIAKPVDFLKIMRKLEKLKKVMMKKIFFMH